MLSDAILQILEEIEADFYKLPTPTEFEVAYQARVASDRIRFAIKHTEQFAPQADPIREVGLQLLDALERLEALDRKFQQRSRYRHYSGRSAAKGTAESNGKEASTASANGQSANGAAS